MEEQVTKNPVFAAKVRDISLEGLGVVDHPSGKIFFVPGVWIDEQVELEVVQEEKRYGIAKLVRLIEASPDRKASECLYQGFSREDCGGCSWMFVHYPAQLTQKRKLVLQAFIRAKLIDEIQSSIVKEVLPSPRVNAYRNRAQFKTDGKVLGFMAQGTNQIIDIKKCLSLNDEMNQKLDQLRSQLPNPDWSPKGYHPWNFIDVDDQTDLHKWPLNRKRAFRQANDEQNWRMKEWIQKKLVKIDSGTEAIELFCGSGNFTEVLSSSGIEPILAIESSPESIDELQSLNLKNVQATHLDLYRKGVWKQIQESGHKPKLLVLDPPRTGFPFLSTTLENLPSIETVIYISCSLQTLVRDLGKLSGWKIEEVQPIDQFPNTPHIELMCLLSKLDPNDRPMFAK